MISKLRQNSNRFKIYIHTYFIYLCFTGVENVPASYFMYEGMQLTFRSGNDNIDLGWTTNGNCIFKSLILDEREPDDTCLGDVWELKFKPIGLVVTPPDIHVFDYGPICHNLPDNCYVITPTYETGSLDLPKNLNLPENVPKIYDIRRHGFRVMPSEAATSYFYQGATIPYPNPVVIDMRIPSKGDIEGASVYVSISRAQSMDQIYLLHELWPKGDDVSKAKYIAKATKSFSYDEDTIACKQRLDNLASKTAAKWGDNHLHYFTHANPNNCAKCGAAAGIL